MRHAWKSISAAAAIALVAGCSTWDSMSNAQKGTAIGAGVVGGVIGREVGERKDERK